MQTQQLYRKDFSISNTQKNSWACFSAVKHHSLLFSM